jgi:hypothetical protein
MSRFPKTRTQKFLKRFHACSDARTWVDKKSLIKAWRECGMASWMRWLISAIDEGGELINSLGVGRKCGACTTYHWDTRTLEWTADDMRSKISEEKLLELAAAHGYTPATPKVETTNEQP